MPSGRAGPRRVLSERAFRPHERHRGTAHLAECSLPALAAWSRHRASCAFPKLPFYGLWRLGRRLRSLRWSPRVAWRSCPVGPLKVVRRPRPPPRGPCAVPHLIVIGVAFKNKVITPHFHIRCQPPHYHVRCQRHFHPLDRA